MCEERAKTRCVQCELVQWADHASCRRCGQVLPAAIVNVVERVVEKVIFRHDPECLENLEQACKLISAASERLQRSEARETTPGQFHSVSAAHAFPTLDEMERAMIVAAYKRSGRRSQEAARLLGIGKTTFYRKLKDMRKAAA